MLGEPIHLRPRISQKEAAYLVEVLALTKSKLASIEAKRVEIHAEIKDLSIRMYVGFSHMEFIRKRHPEEMQRLAQLKKNLHELDKHLHIHNILISKYSAIARGENKRGAYKHINNRLDGAATVDPLTLTELTV